MLMMQIFCPKTVAACFLLQKILKGEGGGNVLGDIAPCSRTSLCCSLLHKVWIQNRCYSLEMITLQAHNISLKQLPYLCQCNENPVEFLLHYTAQGHTITKKNMEISQNVFKIFLYAKKLKFPL